MKLHIVKWSMFCVRVWKNLHRAEKIYMGWAAPVTNMRYAASMHCTPKIQGQILSTWSGPGIVGDEDEGLWNRNGVISKSPENNKS